MDKVPYAFVMSLMEAFRIPEKVNNLKNMLELGRGYGRIAKEVYHKTATCYVFVPGVFCETLNDVMEDEAFVEDRHSDFRSPTSAKNLMELSVIAKNLVFDRSGAPAEGASLREVRRLMAMYKNVTVRELVVRKFPTASIPQRSLFSGLTTFFNKVTLHYHTETDSFQEFLLALVAGKKLQTLAVARERAIIHIMRED
uniref:Mitochodrial transcription termination factor n=1 Tax=Steinernema glaseri TaxID=37863 RepID=A0A1I8AI70_9BILA